MTVLSKAFLDASKELKSYTICGQLIAEPKGNGFRLFDYWRDSWNKEWVVTTLAEGLTEEEAITLGAFIHQHYRKRR